MGGGISIEGNDRHRGVDTKFRVCIAIDFDRRKHNVRFNIKTSGRPDIDSLMRLAEWHYSREMMAIGGRGRFICDQIQVYSNYTKRWTDLTDASMIPNGGQLFVFQPVSGSYDSDPTPSAIPDAIGEASVTSLRPIHVEYSLEHKLRAVFTSVDKTDKKYILLGEVHDYLSKCRSPSTTDFDYTAVERWFSRLNTRGNGRVTYQQWARFGADHPQLVDLLFDRPRSSVNSVPSQVWNQLAKQHQNYVLRRDIRDAFIKSNIDWDPHSVGHLFDAIDSDYSGHITFDEWMRFADRNPSIVSRLHNTADVWSRLTHGKSYALRRDIRDAFIRAGLSWDSTTVEHLFDAIDSDYSGHITYDEWMRFADRNPNIVSRLERGDRTITSHQRSDLWSQLSGGKSYALRRDIRDVFMKLNIKWDYQNVGHLFDAIDSDYSGHITYDEWMRFADGHPSLVRRLEQQQLNNSYSVRDVDKALITSSWGNLTRGRGNYINTSQLLNLMGGAERDYVVRTYPSGKVYWEDWWTLCHLYPQVPNQVSGQQSLGGGYSQSHPRDRDHSQLSSSEIELGWKKYSRSNLLYPTEVPLALGLSSVGFNFPSSPLTWTDWWDFAHTYVPRSDTWSQLTHGKSYALRRDIRDAFIRADLSWDSMTVGHLFDAIDSDYSGHITYDEWMRFADRNPNIVSRLERTASSPSRSYSRTDSSLWSQLTHGKSYALRRDIRDAFIRANLSWDSMTVGHLFDAIDSDYSGHITYDEWMRFADRNQSIISRLERGDRGLDTGRYHHDSSRTQIRTPGDVWSQLTKGKSYAQRRDIRDAFIKSGLEWDQLTVGHLFDAIDSDYSGHITYDEWMRFADRNPNIVSRLERTASSPSRSYSRTDSSLWSQLTHGKSYALRRDIRDAFIRANLSWDSMTVGHLFDAIDSDYSGRITYDEWMRFADRNPSLVSQLERGAVSSPRRSFGESVSRDAHTTRSLWSQLTHGKSYALRRDIRDAFIRADLSWDSMTVGHLFDAIDSDYSGHITYDEWMRFADRNQSIISRLERGDRGLDTGKYHHDSSRTQIRTPGDVWSQLTKGKSYAQRRDIRDAFIKSGLEWDQLTVGHLFDAIDSDYSGHITYDEWMRFTDRNPNIVSRLERTASSPSRSYSRTDSSLWSQLTHGKSYALRRDIRDAFIRANLSWDSMTVGHLFDAIDSDYSGRITYDEWMRFADRNPSLVSQLERGAVSQRSIPRDPYTSGTLWSQLTHGKSYALRRDIRDVFIRANIDWDQLTVGHLFDAIDSDFSGHITYDEWMRFADRNPNIVSRLERGDRGLDTGRYHHDSSRTQIRTPADVSHLWSQLTKGKSYAQRRDIRDAFIKSGLEWDQLTVGHLFDAIDSDYSGHITYDEWMRFADRNPSIVSTLCRRVNSHSNSRFEQSLWSQLTNGKSYALRRDIRDAFIRADLSWDSMTVGHLFDAIDSDYSGRITYDEWMRFADRNPSLVSQLERGAVSSPRRSFGESVSRDAHTTRSLWSQLTHGKSYALRRDIRDAFIRADLSWDSMTVGHLFDAIDSDYSGHITYDEWMRFADRNPNIVSRLERTASSPSRSYSRTDSSLWSQLTHGKSYALRRDIRDAFIRANLSWDSMTVGHLFDAIDSDYSGRITYDEWMRFADRNPSIVSQLERGTVSQRSIPRDPYTSGTLWSQLTHGKSYALRRDIRDAFIRADLSWDSMTVGHLFDAIDSDYSGHITYDEWMRFADRNPNIVSRLERTASSPSRSYSRTDSSLWSQLTHGKSYALRRDIRDAFIRANLSWDSMTVGHLFDAIDSDYSGRITYDEWMRFADRNPSIVSQLERGTVSQRSIPRDPYTRIETEQISSFREGSERNNYFDIERQVNNLWTTMTGTGRKSDVCNIASMMRVFSRSGEPDYIIKSYFRIADGDLDRRVNYSEWVTFARDHPQIIKSLSRHW